MSDIQIQQSPQDTISSLNWAPNSNLLVAGSWDCKAYCWEVQQNGITAPKSMIKHDAPVLCTDFHSDGTKVFTGSCDKTVKIWSLQTGQSSQVAAHDKPVKAVQWIQPLNLLVTGSWDKKLKYWDLRTNNPVGTVDLPERLYCMDVIHPLMVVATADRHVWVFDLNKPTQPFQRKQSALKFQTRSLACFPNKTGYALGSIEGRVSISYVMRKLHDL
jgi:mRNA export factor